MNLKDSTRTCRTGRGERQKASAFRMRNIVGAAAGAGTAGVGVKPMAGVEVASEAVVSGAAVASGGRG
jgi:hypothetical protein